MPASELLRNVGFLCI